MNLRCLVALVVLCITVVVDVDHVAVVDFHDVSFIVVTAVQ